MMWQKLLQQFQIQGDPDKFLPKPTNADLDKFEVETGIKLPAGYRDFLQVFGAGIFDLDAVYLRVRAPYCDVEWMDLGKFLMGTIA